MQRIRVTLLVSFLLAAAPALLANHYSDFYVIPVAGHTAGNNNSLWVSDVAIQNFAAAPLTVTLTFVQSGEANFDNVGPLTTVTVPARGSVMLRDVVKDFRGQMNVLGALLVGGDRAFALTSRAWDQNKGVGQAVHPFRDFLEESLGTTNNALATAYVPGLVANANYRTNLGFVAATANVTGGMTISITLRGADGALLGTKSYFVPGGGALQHRQVSSRDITSQGFDIAAAEYVIVAGSGSVVPYASVIDNTTSDAVFVAGQFPENTPVLGKWSGPSMFRILFDRYSR